jgi:hypothetical protein
VQLNTIDIAVIVAYAIAIFGLAQYVSRDKAGARPKNHARIVQEGGGSRAEPCLPNRER